jgi:hypothetical protein
VDSLSVDICSLFKNDERHKRTEWKGTFLK